jgi:hypothetical protein
MLVSLCSIGIINYTILVKVENPKVILEIAIRIMILIWVMLGLMIPLMIRKIVRVILHSGVDGVKFRNRIMNLLQFILGLQKSRKRMLIEGSIDFQEII